MRKAHTTNPFDSFSEEDDERAKTSEEDFYDCQQEEAIIGAMSSSPPPSKRLAPLDFSGIFAGSETPALDFDLGTRRASGDFFSPLENAMLNFDHTDMESPPKHHRGDASHLEDDPRIAQNVPHCQEDTPLLHQSSGKYSRSNSSITTPPRRKSKTSRDAAGSRRSITLSSKPDPVLRELQGGDHNEFAMEYKLILLEDLGTASSWLVLLLPYFAFCVCLILELYENTNVVVRDPLQPLSMCGSTFVKAPQRHYPRLPDADIPTRPCMSPFEWAIAADDDDGVENDLLAFAGSAFESGALPSMPILSTFLYADAFYSNVSADILSLVSQNRVYVSALVLQENNAVGNARWSLMYASTPQIFAMACKQDQRGEVTNNTTWSCKSPRILDLIFAMPEVAVYAGGNIRIDVFYWLKNPSDSATNDSMINDPAHAFTGAQSILEPTVLGSSYILEHMSPSAMSIDTGVRLVSFAGTLIFLFVWCSILGMKSFFDPCRRAQGDSDGRGNGKIKFWWESPWIVFPERRYALLLLIALLLIQEPVLSVLYFYPELASQYRLNLVADAMIGVGVHCTLFVYLCLFHGFRYHTASVTKKRTEHQRQVMQLKRAAKYVAAAKPDADGGNSEDTIAQYMQHYYDQFGDIDGSATSIHLRLYNDPCADGWADFLLGKLLLLFLGISSVTATAYSSFPPEDLNAAILDENMLEMYRTVYVVGSIIQLCVVILWLVLIVQTAFRTAHLLRKEPFLGTRCAQLSFRIIFAHMALGMIALVVSLLSQTKSLFYKWTIETDSADTIESGLSSLEIMVKVVSEIAREFPYSGTAASVGSGRIIFATVSIVITAFIFLPSQSFDDDNDIDGDKVEVDLFPGTLDAIKERRRLRKDKRLVVNLAKDAKTWRVFPVPIVTSETSSKVPSENSVQLFQDLRMDTINTKGRGLVSLGPYMPVFCLELAYWLNEASWQAYYAPVTSESEVFGAERMNLDGLGLKLEGAVLDEMTNTQAFVATNIAPQIDGDKDTVIVVAFRGTASAANVRTDFRSRQVALLEQLAGIGASPFNIYADKVEICDADGWIWDTPELINDEDVTCIMPAKSAVACMPLFHRKVLRARDFSSDAKAILRATPVAQNTFPMVHEGFQEVYCHVRKKLLNVLLPVYQRQLAKMINLDDSDTALDPSVPLALPKIYITGHSLGGSLAQLLALDLATNCDVVLSVKPQQSVDGDIKPEHELFNLPSPEKRRLITPKEGTQREELRVQPPIAVYTFGQPRIGNKAFSRFYKQRVPHTFRVVNEGDAITSMPNYLCCSGTYKHAGLEVLLDEGQTGNILVGPTVVETVFRFHEVRTSMAAHTLSQYRDCLESAFAQDELQEYYQGHNGTNLTPDVGRSANTPKRPRDSMQDANAAIPDWMVRARGPSST